MITVNYVMIMTCRNDMICHNLIVICRGNLEMEIEQFWCLEPVTLRLPSLSCAPTSIVPGFHKPKIPKINPPKKYKLVDDGYFSLDDG